MTLTQYLDAIAEKLNIGKLPDKLISTYLEAFALHEGVDVSKLPDRLYTTYLEEILKARGVQSVDRLRSSQLEALAKSYGATNLPDKLIRTYLEAIIEGLDADDGSLKIQFTVTGDEAFSYSANSKAVYFMNNDVAWVFKDDIIKATCTHFTFGTGEVLADMKDGEFIFNISSGLGTTTGNVSFRKDSVFTSKDKAVAWFKEQYANGTPVVVTAYFAQ
jgi:hypothetical protein